MFIDTTISHRIADTASWISESGRIAAQSQKKYRNKVIMGVLVFLILIFRFELKSIL